MTEGAEQTLVYAQRDARIVDYQPFQVPGCPIWFRGPAPVGLEPGGYVVCVGAADTLGCLCERPFPDLLATELGLPVVNLGHGGADPGLYGRDAALLGFVNSAVAVVVQTMSARGESNSVYESTGVLQRVRRRADGIVHRGDEAWHLLVANEPIERVRALLEETRRSWVESYRALLAAIEVPTVLFHLSRRSPEQAEALGDIAEMMHVFPQFVTRAMLDEVAPVADGYAECISARGAPQPLFDRMTGERIELEASPGIVWPANDYYPSPEMHADAAAALVPLLRVSARPARSR